MAGKLTLEQVLEAIGLSVENLRAMLDRAAAGVPGGQLGAQQVDAIFARWFQAANILGVLEMAKAELLAAWQTGRAKVQKDASDLA